MFTKANSFLKPQIKNMKNTKLYLVLKNNNWNNFKTHVDNVVLNHPIVNNNRYTKYFSKGTLSEYELKHFIVQFSVFSNLFLKSQLLKVINAPTLEESREGKEILLNELGVIFNNKNKTHNDIVSTTGTIQGGIYKHEASHFEWLLNVGKELNLTYKDLGKEKQATHQTLHFIHKMDELYGSPNDLEAIAASYAIENWAANGFWDELTDGFKNYNKINNKKIPLGFWIYHSKLEQNHADHTIDELKRVYEEGRILDEKKFVKVCKEMLDALQIFWEGMIFI